MSHHLKTDPSTARGNPSAARGLRLLRQSQTASTTIQAALEPYGGLAPQAAATLHDAFDTASTHPVFWPSRASDAAPVVLSGRPSVFDLAEAILQSPEGRAEIHVGPFTEEELDEVENQAAAAAAVASFLGQTLFELEDFELGDGGGLFRMTAYTMPQELRPAAPLPALASATELAAVLTTSGSSHPELTLEPVPEGPRRSELTDRLREAARQASIESGKPLQLFSIEFTNSATRAEFGSAIAAQN